MPRGAAEGSGGQEAEAVEAAAKASAATKPLADTNGIAFPNIAVTNTGRGPRGLAVLDDGSVMVHSFLDRSVADIRYDALREEARGEILNGGFPAATKPKQKMLVLMAIETVRTGRRKARRSSQA